MKKRLSTAEIRQMRLLAGFLLALITILTVLRYWLHGYPVGIPVGLLIIAAAAVVFMLSFVWPEPLAPAFRLWMVVARAIGWFNAQLLLGILFYLILTPIGRIMRMMGRDPLHKEFNSDKMTFWIPKGEPEDGLERYKRQF